MTLVRRFHQPLKTPKTAQQRRKPLERIQKQAPAKERDTKPKGTP